MEVKSLSDVIEFNNSFKTAINLYLSLNKTDKILNYIPTKSSLIVLEEYLDAVINNKENATLLVGPYGKGKSHLLLVLLAILSLERNAENEDVIKQLCNKINGIEEIGTKTTNTIFDIWTDKRFLPVIINDTKGDLNQAFLSALNDALIRANLSELAPNSFFSEAIKRIEEWEDIYPDTYKAFEKAIKKRSFNIAQFKANLLQFSNDTLDLFKEIYPTITAGSTFNPLAAADVIPLYKSVSEKLVEDYGYTGIYIVFDEFSKFIEGIDGKNAGNTMKLLQDMCELAADSSNSQIHITMVAHKSIKEYGKYLSADIINAFTGIEGRLEEKYFITSSKNNYELIRNAIIKDEDKLVNIPGIDAYLSEENCNSFYQLPAFKTSFNKADFYNIVLKGCYPLNPVAAYLLLNVSEKVAQNERTLFTFISNDEPYSMARFVSEHTTENSWVIGADLIYDYFSGLFKKEVSNELVHNVWLGAEYAISKCDSEEEVRLIKTLAIITIVNKVDEIPADERYLALAASLVDSSSTIESLVSRQIIYKKSSIGVYVFKTRAGSELKAEIKKQRELKGSNCNYSKSLQQITGKYFVIPRRYNTDMMMTRYFSHEYMTVETFMSINNASVLFDLSDATDGKVISLYSFERFSQSEVVSHFKGLACPNLVVILPKKTLKCAKALKDFEIIQDLRNNQTFINDNEVLKKELPLLEEDISKEVEEELDDLYSLDGAKLVYLSKGALETETVDKVELAVTYCCRDFYAKTPIINNEIINRKNISSSQTKKARLKIIDAIMKGTDDEEFYQGTNQEATVYRSLFVNTGIVAGKPHSDIEEIINVINDFIDSCCDKKVCINDLIARLTNSPYGVRAGVLPVYIAKVFADRKEDLIVYFSNLEVQLTPEMIVNLCEHSEDYSLFVSEADLLKEQYIKKLNILFNVEGNRALTENRLKNIIICMQRWFRSLPQATRNLASLNDIEQLSVISNNMSAIKKMLQKVEVNPYELLFIQLPQRFSADDLERTYDVLENVKEAFDNYLDLLIENTVSKIYLLWGNSKKKDLFHLLKEWYDNQSSLSKQGLHSGSVTNLMSCIEKLDTYGDYDVCQKVVKAVTNVYVENWIDNALEDFSNELDLVKQAVEKMKDETSSGKLLLSFVGSDGNKIERYYEKVEEGTGTILRNIIEDTLEEYDDLSVNDRVGILLEMIEKIIG